MIPFDPDKIAEELSDRGYAWADTDAAYKALDEATKSVLAECMMGAGDVSVAKAEMYGRTCRVYLDHLAAIKKARQAANRARVDYDTFQAWIELKRTEQATRRAEMGLR
jgi:hypothetical protein